MRMYKIVMSYEKSQGVDKSYKCTPFQTIYHLTYSNLPKFQEKLVNRALGNNLQRISSNT